MLERFVWLVPALPLFAALWIAAGYVLGRNRGEAGERPTTRVATGASALSLLLVLALDLQALWRGAPGQVVLGQWLDLPPYTIAFSFTLDGLGLGMATLVAVLSFFSLRFSVNYLHREAGFQRFFLVLSLFTGAMQLIVTAGNAVLAFAGWELAGVSSYLLIAYAFERPTATDNATRAFVTNRIGDAGFLAGLFLAFGWFGTTEWPTLAAQAGNLESLSIGLVAGGFVLAALVKSAQVPFSPWITRALEGPTPSSAIFYGALLVHAGVYLLLRLQPLLEQAPALLLLLSVVGLLTAVYGFLGGMVQSDAKTALIFSTLGQVGLMVLACGLGWFELATWHLALHATWRAYQFLSSPGMLHLPSRTARPVPAWLGRCRPLFTATLQRFWLDHLADWLLTRPTQALAQDVELFDQQVVNRLVGPPVQPGALTTLADWELRQRGTAGGSVIGRGYGLAGKLMEWLAARLHWFEEQLVLRGSGEGLVHVLRRMGRYVQEAEDLLGEPRYLILIIVATFIVIL